MINSVRTVRNCLESASNKLKAPDIVCYNRSRVCHRVRINSFS